MANAGFDDLPVKRVAGKAKPPAGGITPPQNDTEAEQAILGGVLIDSELIAGIADSLKPEHFSDTTNQEIYRQLLTLYRQGKEISPVTATTNQQHREYLATLIDKAIPLPHNLEDYARMVTEHYQRRQLAKATEETIKSLTSQDISLKQILGKLQEAIGHTEQATGSETLRPDSERLTEFLEEVERRKELNTSGRYSGLDTGFKHLNEVTLGLQPGLWILGARPSLGKTTLLKQLVDSVAMNNPGIPCLLVSYEQSSLELTLKTISRFAKVNSRNIQKGRLSEAENTQVNQAIDSYAPHAKNIYVYEADGASTDTQTIQTKARFIMNQHQAKQIFIALDYLQLIPSSNGGYVKSDKERLDRVVSELRRMARNLNSPVVAVSSLNRPAYSNGSKTNLSSFKESGGIEYSADIAITLDEDEEETRSLTRRENKPMRAIKLNIHKNRNGERSRIRMVFDMPYATFTETTKEALEAEE